MRRSTAFGIMFLFLFFIVIPPSLWLLTPDTEISTFEKRRLRAVPTCSSIPECVSSYPEQLEKYYLDHFGLRDKFISLHNYICLKLYNKSPNPNVTIGADDWLYFNADHSLVDFLGLWKADRRQLESWRRVLRDRQEWLADLGIHYLMVIIPFKMMVYPEYLPSRIRRLAGIPLMLDFLEYLKINGGSSGMVNVLHELREPKVKFPTFYRTDTHWNMEGAYRAYLAIMHRVQQWYPEIKVLDETERIIEKIEYAGDLSTMLHLPRTLKEWAIDVQIKDPCKHNVSYRGDKEVSSPPEQTEKNGGSFLMELGCPDNSHSLLVIHDSYGKYIKPYFDESFGKIIYSHDTFQNLKTMIKKEHPSLIIDQRAARYFARMLGPDPEIEDYVMHKHFQVSRDQRFFINKDIGSTQFVSINDCELTQASDGLFLRAFGHDPFVEIAFSHTPKPDCFLVRVEITSSVATTMQLFFTTVKNDIFSPDMVVSKKMKKGYNEFLFRLPHPDILGKIRLDPGMIAGEYTLHSFSINGEWYGI